MLLILANKQDLEGAMSPIEITQQLKLHLNKDHAWQIQPCSALTGAGLFEGMVSGGRPALSLPSTLPCAQPAVPHYHALNPTPGLGSSHPADKAMRHWLILYPASIVLTRTRERRCAVWKGQGSCPCHRRVRLCARPRGKCAVELGVPG